MFNKQVDGVKFKELQGGKMEIVYPDTPKYKDYYYHQRVVAFDRGIEEYKILFAQKYADKVFDSVLKELGLNVKTAHLLCENDTIKKDGEVLTHYYAGIRRYVTYPQAVFGAYLEKALKKKGVDLSYLSTETDKYKLKIAGNAGSIAWDYRQFLFKTPWQECEISSAELGKYIRSHQNIKILEETNDGYRLINRERLLATKFGTETNHRGIGSQASIAIHKVKLKKDSKGNLLITRSTEIWD